VFSGVLFPNAPPVTTTCRHAMAVLALGDKAEPVSFYASLTEVSVVPQHMEPAPMEAATANNTDSTSLSASTQAQSSSAITNKEELLAEIISLLRVKHDKFSSSLSGLQTMRKRLQRVQSVGQSESFMHTIPYQSALGERTDGETGDHTADEFATFFTNKVDSVRAATATTP